MLQNLTLGADPEFLIENKADGRFEPACYALLNASTRSTIGVDGCSNTGEMRVPPQKNHKKMFKAIKHLINVQLPNSLDISKYDVTAGSGKFAPTGGHIHFNGIGRKPTIYFLKNVYKYISSPLNEISDNINRSSYGGELDYETKSYGGFEARSPLSWLASPKITKGVFAISEIIAEFGKDKIINSWDELLSFANNEQKITINSYLKEIKWFKDNNHTLEEVSIIKAWKDKKHISKSIIKSSKGLHSLAYSADFNMLEICGNVNSPLPLCRFRLSIVGLNMSRDSEQAVYLPRMFKNTDIKLPNKIHGVKIKIGDSSSLGLTKALRNDVEKSRKVLKSVIYLLNNIAKTHKDVLKAYM